MKSFISRKDNARKVFIIAEAGINHNGSVVIAKKMVDVAHKAGADAVKFQTFKADKEISRYADKAEYQKKTTGKTESQLEMARKLELKESEFKELRNHCKKKKIVFLSSPSDLDSIGFLAELGLDTLKIPSGEITNLPYLRKIGNLRKKLILSTGMSNLKEISDALDVLTKAGTKKEDIVVLHCNTEYPTPYKNANLLSMLTIRDALGITVGYSDHTLGIEVSVAAAALGAAVIEKHFTLDRKMKGPDHSASLEPHELAAMVKAIRNVEDALGDGIKKASPSELKNKEVARKSIVAAKKINIGDMFTEENITTKRPGLGISPMEWGNVIGKTAKKCFKEDELIEV